LKTKEHSIKWLTQDRPIVELAEDVDLDVVVTEDVVDAVEIADVEAVEAPAPEADAETRKREVLGSP